MKNNPIGIFDSGVGGLSVLKEIAQRLPNEDYIYFGDTARVPYGEKNEEELIGYSREILDWFKRKNVKAVLMACNTSSAITLDIVQDEYDFPVYGLIKPASQFFAAKQSRIGVLATSATVKADAYKNNILKSSCDCEVFQVECPGWVEIVENGLIDEASSRGLVEKYVKKLIEQDVEHIVFGCTHYPFLADLIKEVAPEHVQLIDPAVFLTDFVENDLKEKDLISNSIKGSKYYFVSSNPEKFIKNARLFYSGCEFVQKTDLTD